MPIIHADELKRMSARIFEAAGASPEIAWRVSESLVEGNLTGHDSHGVIRIMQYFDDINRGDLDPRAEIEIVSETPTTALIDAHNAFGQVAAAKGMNVAIEKAKQHHVSAVGIRHTHHIGRLGEYTLMAAREGLVGIVMCNSGPGRRAAPFGGLEAMFSTNPISIAAPAGEKRPFLLDYASTMVAEGKLRVAREKGEHVRPGLIVDKEGKPTTDPLDFYNGGFLLHMGEHKGYALGLLVDILGGVLTGHGATSLPEYKSGNGTFMIVVDIAPFMPLEQFKERLDCLFEGIKNVKKAPGVSEVLIPGEPEFNGREQRLRDGIIVPDAIWKSMVECGQKLSVDITAAPE